MAMYKLALVAAALIIATPALSQTRGLFGERRGPGPYDYSAESGNSRQAPAFQSRGAGRLQTGSGQETGGYARERIPSSTGGISRTKRMKKR
jgi:hypothetical protein